PATLADLAIAVLAYRSLRSRPRVAVAAAVAIAIHPAFIDVSAWWGQFESIYALFGLLALLLAWSDRPYLAAVALALAVMAKPQALPFLVPFAAWFLGRYGLRRSIPIGIVWAAVVGLLWLPFVADGGPGRYLSNLDGYQNGVFAVLSLRAWNAWWLLQEAAGQVFLSDSGGLIGPITARHVGLVLAGLVELLVFVSVLRRPSARGLALGLAASTLVAFSLLTTMHERYAFAALVFLVPLIDDRRVAIVWIALGAVITLNLVAAIPPTPEIGRLLPVFGPLGIVGSLGMLSLTVASVALLRAEAGRGTPPRTSAGSGAATPGT
ncbi:MAG TPA: hypothetical protein VIV06_00670, partial [Candidatus Limnocylindrales bacterium]